MSVDQPSLFDAPATRGASRNSDPQTSRDAARSMEGHVLRAQQWLVLGVAKVQCQWPMDGERGTTAYEVWQFANDQGNRIKENVVARRLTELGELGLIELTGDARPGSSHRNQQVWQITDKGRAYLADRSAA